MNSNKILKKATLKLRKFGILTPELDAKILLGHVLGKDKKIYFHEDFKIDKKKEDEFKNIIKMRLLGKPVSRIIGKRGFWRDDFFISKFTLDPRPDSEILIEACLDYFKDKSSKLQILDLGSGSGCIGLSILKEFPSSFLVNVDACKNAINQANLNAKNLGSFNKVKSINANWFENNWTDIIQKKLIYSKLSLNDKFDLIVCNPPYIKSNQLNKLQVEVKNHDPIIALDGGVDGCDSYRGIFLEIKKILSHDGIIILEIGHDVLSNVKKIVKKSGFQVLKIYKDLAGIERVLLIK